MAPTPIGCNLDQTMHKIPQRGVSRCLNRTRSIYTHVRHNHSTLVTIQVDSSPSCVVCSETDRLVTLHDCLTSMYIYGHGKTQRYARAASHAEAIDRAKLKQCHYATYLEYSQNSGCKHTHNTDTHTHTHTNTATLTDVVEARATVLKWTGTLLRFSY